MSNFEYSETIPDNFSSSGYGQFDNVDFLLNFPNRKLINNSIRINGTLNLLQAGTTVSTEDIFIDNDAGSHAFFSDITTSLQNVGMIESVTEYPRLVKTRRIASKSYVDYLQADHCVELAGPSAIQSSQAAKALRIDGTDAAPDTLIDFSIKPLISLNRMSSASRAPAMSFRKSGAVRISLRLARNLAVLFGSAVDSTSSYTLTDLKITYSTIPDDGTDEALTMENVTSIKTTISSSAANIAAQVPAIAKSMTCSAMVQAHEFTSTYNNLACENVPNLNRLQFLFNDSTNKLVTYQINSQSEILARFVESVDNSGHSSLSPWSQCRSDNYGFGLGFGQFLDLRNQTIQVQLTSDVTSSVPMIVFLYFNGIVQL